MSLRNLVVTGLALGCLAAGARAAELPVPKVMSDSPPDKGSWRMDTLQMSGISAEQLKAMSGMTVCQTAAQAMAREDPATAGRCSQKLVEDSASRAVIDLRCTGENPISLRSSITRAAPRTYDVTPDMTLDGQRQTIRTRMTHLGPCSEKDQLIRMPKDAAACKNLAAELATLDPATKCANACGAAAQLQVVFRKGDRFIFLEEK